MDNELRRQLARLQQDVRELKAEINRSPVRIATNRGGGGGGLELHYAVCKEDASAKPTITCYLDPVWGEDMEDYVEIEVHQLFFQNLESNPLMNLNQVVPRLQMLDILIVAYMAPLAQYVIPPPGGISDKYWYAVNVFFSPSVDCGCYGAE